MPIQVSTQEEFKELLKIAKEVRMKRSKGSTVKLKIRAKNYLYTYVCEPKEADALWREVKISKTEIK